MNREQMYRYGGSALALFMGLMFLSFGSGDGPGALLAWWIGVVTSLSAVTCGFREWVRGPDDDDGWSGL